MKPYLKPKCGLTWLGTETLLYQFLTQEAEQDKLHEAKDTPSVPVRTSTPFRMLIVWVSVLMVVTLQGFYILPTERNLKFQLLLLGMWLTMLRQYEVNSHSVLALNGLSPNQDAETTGRDRQP